MRYLLSIILAIFAATTLRAQEQSYPNWIAERYCATWQNKSECLSKLKVSDLYGQSQGLAQTSDDDNDGEQDQWGQDKTLPRLAQCTYANLNRPDWNFDSTCFYTVGTRVSAFVTQTMRVGVENGSSFNLVAVHEQGQPSRYFANDEPAFRAQGKDRSCFTLKQSPEEFCVVNYDEGAVPSSPSQTNTTPPASITERQGICSVLRGETKLDEDPCTEEIACTIGEDSGEANCVQRYRWPSGSITVLEMFEGYAVDAINGAPASGLDGNAAYWGHDKERNCAVNDNSGNTFCFALSGQEVVTEHSPTTTSNILSELPKLSEWMTKEERPKQEIFTLLAVITQHRDADGLTFMLENPRENQLDLLAAIFSTASYWPSAIVRELFEHEGFKTVYTDIDFSTRDEDSMMFEHTNAKGRSYKFWTTTGSEGTFPTGNDWTQNLTLGLTLMSPEIVNGKSVNVKGKVLKALVPKSLFIFSTMYSRVRINPDYSMPETTFVVTGHSQGGMIAGILAAMLHEYVGVSGINSDLRLVTFGNPGSGDRTLANNYAERILSRNFVNKEDLVPFAFRLAPARTSAYRYGSDIVFELDANSAPDFLNGNGAFADHTMAYTYLLEASRRVLGK